MKEAYQDVEPFGYLFLAGVIIVLGSGLLGLIALSIIGWLKKSKPVKWGSLGAAFAITVILALFISDPHFVLGPNNYPYLKQPPNPGELAATYRLPLFSISRIKEMNYAGSDTKVADVKVMLHSDGTFETTPAPEMWGRKEIGKCSGNWIVECADSGVYHVLLTPKIFSPRMAKAEAELPSSVCAGIAAKTKTRPYYALAIPLYDRDSDFIFIQEHSTSSH